jgi:hypothetical protein
MVMLACFAASAADTCPGTLGSYNGYTVAAVDVIDPIGFLAPWNALDHKLREGLRVKKNGVFSNSEFQQDSQWLGNTLRSQFAASQLKVKFAYAGGAIVDCNPADASAKTPGTLRVVYPIFISVLPTPLPTFEEQSTEVRRPGTTGALRAAKSRPSIVPLAGNDTTRGTFGGLAFSERTSALDFAGQTEISGNSRSGYVTLGSVGAAGSSADHRAVWAGSFVYDDTPAGVARYREGKFTFRGSFATKEFGSARSILRYGMAVEAGRQEAEGAGGATPSNSSVGAVKVYAGLTGRPGTSGFTASMGFQLGSTFRTASPSFQKYLVDAGYNHAFPIHRPKPLGDRDDFTHVGLTGGVHRSLFFESRVTAGFLRDVAGAPLAERFYGGNVVQRFIPDDSWSIPSGAFIRSIPENRLGAEFGGNRFVSANATLAITAWGRPFLPKELVLSDSAQKGGSDDGTGFPEVLNFPFKTAAKSLANTKELNDPAFLAQMKDVSAKAAQLSQKTTDVSNLLKQIPADLAGGRSLKPLIGGVRSDALMVRVAANQVAARPDGQIVVILATASVPALVTAIGQLANGLAGTAGASLVPALQSLATEMTGLMSQIGRESDVPKGKYLDAAWKDLAPGHRALDVLLHDLNIYSIAPVAMIDAARVWPGGVRYGIGPGLRMSLLNVNLTFGYSYNPRRLPGEKPGAIYVKLDFTSLF